MANQDIKEYLRPGRRVHLVGIGGVSMAPLGEVLHGAGVAVTGSDMRESEMVQHLRDVGIPVRIGHLSGNVEGTECVIRTAAVHDDNPEIAAARAAGIPVFERAQAWGAIMRDYQNAVCISGTHGKTTTTSMCTHIFLAAGLDPTVMIGGTLPLLHSGYRVGQGDTIVLESCEYCNSFLSFYPTVAVILNVEEDHLDFFKDLEEIEGSFRRFAELVPADTGVVVANADDPGAMEALVDMDDRELITFGLDGGDVHSANLVWENGLPEFDIMWNGLRYAHVRLNVPGIHNVKNALAAASAAIALGVTGSSVEEGLAGFHGVGRRFEFKGKYRGADVYDDYAHHPSELDALLTTAESLGYERIICAFQPHTYSRTKALFADFVRVLKKADLAILTEIYAAREQNTIGISARDVAEQIPGAEFCATLEDTERRLRELARPGDLILTVGAGDIYTVGEKLVEG